MTTFFRFELIGGPFDGSKGLAWVDDGGHPLPDRIFVGRCDGGDCRDAGCPGRSHVWYWVRGDARPEVTVKYLKADTELLLGADSVLAGGDELWLARFVHSEAIMPTVERDERVLMGVGRSTATPAPERTLA